MWLYSAGEGTVTVAAKGKAKASKVKVKQDGKVTLRMGLKEGKVTILIKSAGTNNWNEATKEVVVKIK